MSAVVALLGFPVLPTLTRTAENSFRHCCFLLFDRAASR
jgi:hypothetical protein